MQMKLLGARGKWKKELKKQVAQLDREVAQLHFEIRGVGKSPDVWALPEGKEVIHEAAAPKGITMASSPMGLGGSCGSPVPKLALPTTPSAPVAIDTKQLEACLETFRQQVGQEAFEAACNQQTSRSTYMQKDIGENSFGDAEMVECSRDTLNSSIAWISKLLQRQDALNTHREALETARARIVNNDEIEESVQSDVRCRASSIMSVDSDGFPNARSRQNTMDSLANGRGRGDSVTSVDSDGFPRMLETLGTPKHLAPTFSMMDHFAQSKAVSGSVGEDQVKEPLSPAQRIKAHRAELTSADLNGIPDAGFTPSTSDEPDEQSIEKPTLFKGLQLDEVRRPEYQASINDIMKLTPRNFNNKIEGYLNQVMTLSPRALTDKLDDYLAAVCTDSYALEHNVIDDITDDIGIPSGNP